MSVDNFDQPIVDGFLYSASQLYLPTSFRASALSQMEILRRARGYRTRWFLVPEDVNEPIPAYSQAEYQVQTQPGAYLWGMSFSVPTDTAQSNLFFIQVTDNCTETPLFSDYVWGQNLQMEVGASIQPAARHPVIFPQPRLIGKPGTLNVEVYNSSNTQTTSQLVLFCAEPCVPSQDILDVLQQKGLIQ